MIKMPGDRLEKKRIEEIQNVFNIDPPRPKLRDKFKMAYQFLIKIFNTPKR
jgi:hypothetical protein